MSTELAATMGATRAGWLDRPGEHRVAWYESGDSDGLPILVVHGGPGDGADPIHRSPLDPDRWRIVQIDQRACGHSTPWLELRGNTTSDLIGDIEAVRVMLGIERWAVLGGSWGSTLALAYGQAHPERVTGFLLRAIFLCRDRDIDWTVSPDGAARLRPDGFAVFAAAVDRHPGESLQDAYGRALCDDDAERALRAARAWVEWEDSLCYLHDEDRSPLSDENALAIARLEHHYLSERGFLAEGQLLNDLASIAHLPAFLVHGRHDLCCLVEQAWDLHMAWPQSHLEIVRGASHAASERPMVEALEAAAKELHTTIGRRGDPA